MKITKRVLALLMVVLTMFSMTSVAYGLSEGKSVPGLDYKAHDELASLKDRKSVV